MVHALTVNEAAAIVGMDEGKVRKEVEHGLFGSESPPRFKLPALVYFRTLVVLGLQPSVEERKKLYMLIDRAFTRSKKPARVEVSPVLELKLDEVTQEIMSKLECFEAWKKKVVIDKDILGGEPVFPKSRLAVRHIGGMLLRGGPIEEIREDYPYLKPEDIEFAKLYTVAYPRVGRPRERKASSMRTFRRGSLRCCVPKMASTRAMFEIGTSSG
jgi:uncharacterized protein (DUF433 family)